MGADLGSTLEDGGAANRTILPPCRVTSRTVTWRARGFASGRALSSRELFSGRDGLNPPLGAPQSVSPCWGARRVRVALVLAVCSHGGGLGAQPPQAPVGSEVLARLDYAGSPCADGTTLQALVLRRSTRIRFADVPDARPVAVAVQAPQGPNPWQAHIVVGAPTGPSTVRRIEANTCAALVDATGFVIAVTLDPPVAEEPLHHGALPTDPSAQDGGSNPVPEPTSSSPSPTAAPPPHGSSPTAAEQRREGASSGAGPTGTRRGSDARSDVRGSSEAETPLDTAPPTSGGLQHTLGLGAAVATSAAPSPLLGGALFWMVSPRHVRTGVSFSPMLRVSAAHTRGSGFGGDEGKAAFQLTTGSLELCPWNFGSASWGVRPCALVIGGQLAAQGSDTVAAERHSRPWAVVGGALDVHGALGARWHLMLDLGAGTTLVRDEFVFVPTLLHQVPNWSAQATVGVGVVLP